MLAGKTIGLICDFSYEDLEVHYPKLRLEEEGAKVVVIGGHPKGTKYTGKFGYPVICDMHIDDVKAEDLAALVIPGGFGAEYLRRQDPMKQLVRDVHSAGKVVAAICHGPWVLISAKVLSGVKCTSFIGIRDDVENAGGLWEDTEVVCDRKIITARVPQDLIPFCKAIIKEMS
jgi:protease I